MSDTTDILETMRTQLRELELDHVQLAGRIMQLRDSMALIENGPRRKPGRPRRIEAVATDTPNGPQGVAGGIFDTPTDIEVA